MNPTPAHTTPIIAAGHVGRPRSAAIAAAPIMMKIFLDNHALVADPQPTWMGYSKGWWDGDTLIVETTGFNDKTWLDDAGHPHSEQMKVTERFRRPDYGHLFVDITIQDPMAYAKPWTVTQEFQAMPDGELIEYVCNENNLDLPPRA